MPLDEGYMGINPRTRRARKRAGVRKPTAKFTPRADTGADKAAVAAKAKADPSARIDRPAEKARVAVQGRARTAFEQVQATGTLSAKQRLATIAKGLTEPEKKDLQGYTRAESQRTQERLNPLRRTDVAIGDVVGVRPTDLAWSLKNPVDALTGSDKSVRRGIDRGILKESEEFPGSYEPAGVMAGGMMAFPGFGKFGGKAAAGASNRIPFLYDKEGNIAIGKQGGDHGQIGGPLGKRFKEGDIGHEEGVRQGGINIGEGDHAIHADDIPLTPAQMEVARKAALKARRVKVPKQSPKVVQRKAERAALDVLAKADVPLETLAKRYAKAIKAGDDELAALHAATADVIKQADARRAAGKKPTPFDKQVAAQEAKVGEYVTLYRGMGMDEYSTWSKRGTKIAPGTRFIKQDEEYANAVGDLYKFTVHRDDVVETSPGVYELTNELKLSAGGKLAPVVRGAGVTTQGEKALEVMNVPRAVKSSFDISAPFRQGIVLMGADAKLWKQSWAPMVKALRENTGEAERITKEIHDDPLYELAKDRINFTELRGKLNEVEENFLGLDMASKIPIGGKGVEASSRAYNTFLNKLRMDFFRYYVDDAMKKGYDLSGNTDESNYLLDSIADWVNVASGRGGKVDAGKTLAFLNATLFSPRLMISRLKLLDPTWYLGVPKVRKGMHPYVRAQAGKAMGKLAGEIGATLFLADQAGAGVEWDPRSSDFGKIKLGDTRIDIAGGLAQYITLYARQASRQTKTGAGEVVDLEGGYAGRDAFDVLMDFAENKTAPVVGTAINERKQESAPGVPFSYWKDPLRLFAPIGVENTVDALAQGQYAGAAATATLGSVGFGVDTYPTLSKAKPRTAEARMEASIKKMVAKELPLAKKYGWKQVPPHIVQAITLKGRIDARVKALTKDQKKAKNARTTFEDGDRFGLTGRQRAAAVLTALRDYVPNFNYEGAKLDTQNLNDNALENYTNNLRDFYYGETLRDWHGSS